MPVTPGKRIRLKNDGGTFPDPGSAFLVGAAWALRYERGRLTEAEAFEIAAVVDAYRHFVLHPSPTAGILKQLRELRRAARERILGAKCRT